MFKIKNPTKKLKEICANLGPNYSITVIDYEPVIYRKINDYFDIEVAGLNNNRKTMNATIYLWQLKPGKQNIVTITDITSFEQLQATLEDLCESYQNLN